METKRFQKNDSGFLCASCGKEVLPLGYTSRNHCPFCLWSLHVDVNPGDRANTCGGQMEGTRWFSQPGKRYMDLATCPECGKFLIRVRLSEQPDGTIRVSRLTYEATSEAAEAYARRAEKAEPDNHHSTPRRRRRRSQASKLAEQKESE